MADDVKTVTPAPGTTPLHRAGLTGSGLERSHRSRWIMPRTWLGKAWWSTSLRPHQRLQGHDMIDLDRYVLKHCMATWGRPVTYYNWADPPLDTTPITH